METPGHRTDEDWPPAEGGPPDRRQLTDAELVELLFQRDGGALDVLYDRYAKPVYGLARRVIGDDGFAQDVVQDVFLTLWQNPGRFDANRAKFSSWLLSVTHHKAVDAVRREESMRRCRSKASEQFDIDSDSHEYAHGVYEKVWSSLRNERVRAALRMLPEKQREALVLAYFGGYTQSEVATVTDTPLGTVKTRMLTGMRRMREALGGGAVTDGGAW